MISHADRIKVDIKEIIRENAPSVLLSEVIVKKTGTTPASETIPSEDIFDVAIFGTSHSFHSKQLAQEGIKQDEYTGALWRRRVLNIHNKIAVAGYVENGNPLPAVPALQDTDFSQVAAEFPHTHEDGADQKANVVSTATHVNGEKAVR